MAPAEVSAAISGDFEAFLLGRQGAGQRPMEAAGLARALLRHGALSNVGLATSAYIVGALLTLVAPLSIFALLRWFEDPAQPLFVGFICVAVNAISVAGQHVCHWVYTTRSALAGLQGQVAVSAALYRASLRLSVGTLGRFKTGELTMLLASDAENLVDMWSGLVALTIQPIELAAIICLLWLVVAHATLGALAWAGVSYAVSQIGGRAIERHNGRRSALSDQRLKIISEVLYGIKVVKANGWTPRFRDKIRSLARAESSFSLAKKRWMGLVITATNEMVDVMAFTVAALSILAFGNTPRASDLFTMWVFMSVLHGKIFSIPDTLRTVTTSWTSLRRFAAFFNALGSTAPPLHPAGPRTAVDLDESCTSIRMRKATLSYLEPCGSALEHRARAVGQDSFDKQATALACVDLDLSLGRLYAVVGAVGSGKSSLLLGLLNELCTSADTEIVRPAGAISCAYVPQDPIVFNETVRENVCFGLPYEADKYKQVCTACALDHDILLFPDGDATVIGSRGINISGGQQSRICLARAVYSGADVYLLDDPLAKLDVKVSAHVFAAAILGVLRQSTRLMVTNSRHVVRQCDDVIVVEGGGAQIQSSPPSIVEEGEPSAGSADGGGAPDLPGPCQEEQTDGHGALLASIATDGQKEHPRALVFLFLEHVVAGVGSRWKFFLYAASVVLEVVSIELAVSVLVHWSDDPEEANYTNEWYGAAYGFFVICELLVAQVKFLMLASFTQRSWDSLHDNLLTCVLDSSLMWLQSVPVGQVLQLFSGSLARIEDQTFDVTEMLVLNGAFVIAISAVVCMVFPLFAVFLFVFALVVYCLMRYDTADRLEAQTLASSLTTACLQHYTETVGGLVVVRNFPGAAARFTSQFDDILRRRCSAQAMCKLADEMKLFRLRLAGAMYYTVATMAIVLAREFLSTSPGFAGFLVVNSVFFGIVFITSVDRSFTIMEVGRDRADIEKLVNTVPREAGAERGADGRQSLVTPPAWPSSGHISIENLELKYKPDLPPALRGLSLEVQAGEHVGIVGRTGSGKSSLVLAFVRLVEPSGGRIILDGVDIAQVGLLELRRHLGVLSQDPLFFSGSLRDNLDPFGEHQSDTLWDALTDVGLAELFADSVGGLNATVAELGGNLSVGQRQLLCLARAMLMKPRVLLVDEATAALDMVADARVQDVLESRFGAHGVSMLQVAHRLWSVARCHRVAVFEDGRLAELGKPAELLSTHEGRTSRFQQMVAHLGKHEAAAFHSALATGCSGVAPLKPEATMVSI